VESSEREELKKTRLLKYGKDPLLNKFIRLMRSGRFIFEVVDLMVARRT